MLAAELSFLYQELVAIYDTNVAEELSFMVSTVVMAECLLPSLIYFVAWLV